MNSRTTRPLRQPVPRLPSRSDPSRPLSGAAVRLRCGSARRLLPADRRREDPGGFDGLGGGTGGFPNWTSEQALTGVRWGDNKNRGAGVLLTQDLFPLLWRGRVKSGASIQGHVWYAPTAAGFELAERREADGRAVSWRRPWYCAGGDEDAGPPWANQPDCEAAYDRYHDERQAEIERIANAKPSDTREIGALPLPVCPVLRKWHDAALTPATATR
jgi:hypothetical protein